MNSISTVVSVIIAAPWATFVDPLIELFHLIQLGSTHEVEPLGMGLDHARSLSTGVSDGVVDTGLRGTCSLRNWIPTFISSRASRALRPNSGDMAAWAETPESDSISDSWP